MSFFTWQGRKQTVQGKCFLNERQPNSLEHEDCSWWQRHKTWLQWLMWIATQHIGKDIKASSYFFTWRVANVVSEACFTVMTRDYHNERAVICMNFNNYASLVIFFIISVLFCFFFFEHWILYTIWVLAAFDFHYCIRKLAI